jgi:hypothetical protein
MRAVPWLPWWSMSATTTLAASRANASAVARPIPLWLLALGVGLLVTA